MGLAPLGQAPLGWQPGLLGCLGLSQACTTNANPLQFSWLGYSALSRATRVRVAVAEFSKDVGTGVG